MPADDMDRVFKALADANRRAMLDRLRVDNGQTLTRLTEAAGMTRQAVAKHLTVLERAGLVVTVWHGREKLHYINPEPISRIHERWIGRFERRRVRALLDLKRALEEKQHG